MQKFVSTRIASTRISRPSQPGQKKGWRTRVIAPHYAFPSLAWRRKVLRVASNPHPFCAVLTGTVATVRCSIVGWFTRTPDGGTATGAGGCGARFPALVRQAHRAGRLAVRK
jgi:hypothetical protein